MTEEEKEELQELINLLYNGHISQYGKRKLEKYIDKLQKENQELKNKLKEIEEIVDTRPYVAYTDYGDLLYESDEILEIIRGGENTEEEIEKTLDEIFNEDTQTIRERMKSLIKSYDNALNELVEKDKKIEPLNAYKLMEAPYMAKLLKEQRYDEFMEHLKQSEVEIANKVIELIRASNKK